MLNAETVKKHRDPENKHSLITQKRERPWHKPLFWQEGIHETHLSSKYELNRFNPSGVIANVSLFLLSY